MKYRSASLDAAKAISMFLIVAIHTQPFLHHTFGNSFFETLGIAINSIARLGVPFFFMLFGYLVATNCRNKTETFDYIVIFSKRIIVLYVIWSLFYLGLDVVLNSWDSDNFDIMAMFASVNLLSLAYYGEYHLWFLISLFYASLALCFIVFSARLKLYLMVFLALYLTGLLGQSYKTFLEIPLQTRDSLFFGTFFVLIGYLIPTLKINEMRWENGRYLCLAFLLACALQVIETVILLDNFQTRLGNYYIFTPVLCFLFMLIVTSKGKFFDIISTRISYIGRYTLGIYLIHPAIIRILNEWNNFESFKNTVVGQASIVPIIFGLSLLITIGFKKIMILSTISFSK